MHSRWAFQWRRKEKASNMVEYVFLKIFFWWYRSVACVYFSQQLPLHLLLSKLNFMQLLWTNCLWTSQTFFPFYRPKSSALNNVWIHQHQLKNMSLSQQSTGIKMSNWTEEVIWNSCRVGLFNELSQAQKRGCFLCSTHFGSKLTNHGRAAELSILFSWKLWKKSVPVNLRRTASYLRWIALNYFQIVLKFI